MRYLLLCMVAVVALAQNPNVAVYPNAIATDTDLLVASNNANTTLTQSISASATTLFLKEWTRFTSPVIISIDTEILRCPSNVNGLYTCQRGFNGTTAISHAVGAPVHGYIVAWHHDQMAAEIKAIEGALGVNLGSVLTFYPDTYGNPATFYAACSAAIGAGKTLAVTKAWTGVASGTCAAALMFAGGSIQPASGQVVTLSKLAQCLPGSFDVSVAGSGSVLFSADPNNVGSNPRCFGAKGDGATDDTLALQASLAATEVAGGTITSSAKWVLPVGNYHYSTGLVSQAWGARLEGESKFNSILTWTGAIGHAFTTEGFFVTGGNFQISDGGTGWAEGFDWEGSQGTITDLTIECSSHPGNGMTAASQSIGQSDQLAVIKPYIANCTSGRGFENFSANALSINFYNPTIGGNWIGIQSNTSSNLGIFGGEIDANDVNFMPGAGSTFLVEGVRSENSKRAMFTGSGAYQQNFTLTNYNESNTVTTRAAATGTGSSGASAVALSVAGYTFGDQIQFAGETGSPVHKITAMSDPTHITGMSASLASNISGASVSLASVKQNDLEENGGGPYVHIGNAFGGTASTSVLANGPQVFIGNYWAMNISNPFGLTLASSPPSPGPGVLFGNTYSGSLAPTKNSIGRLIPVTPAAGTTTIDVSMVDMVFTANTVGSPACIATLQGGTQGQIVYIAIQDSHTTFCSGGNLQFGSASSPVTATQTLTYQFQALLNGGPWRLLGSSGQ